MKLCIVVSARRNSKYLAKFLFGLMKNTNNQHPAELEVRVMLSEHDDWNDELVDHFSNHQGYVSVQFFRENLQLGRAGLHEYFNQLLVGCDADWYVYFCEDHFITQPGWDELLQDYVDGVKRSGDSAGKKFPLNPYEPWVLVPKFDNCGAMNHIVSRGFIQALGGRFGNHGWIDSYINDLMRPFPDRVIRIDEEWFHDFTHDQPSPMSESHVQSLSTEKGKLLPAYEDQRVEKKIKADQERLRRSLEGRK